MSELRNRRHAVQEELGLNDSKSNLKLNVQFRKKKNVKQIRKEKG